jgi:hypothetical protein
LRRIGVRATAELSEAFAAGKLTLRRYDILSRHAATKRRAIIAKQEQEAEHARLAAKAINGLLDGAKYVSAPVRLAEVAAAICEAVHAARPTPY